MALRLLAGCHLARALAGRGLCGLALVVSLFCVSVPRAGADPKDETASWLQRISNWVDGNPERVLGELNSRGVFPKLTSFSQGTGAAPGVNYWSPGLAGSELDLFAAAARSFRGDHLLQLRLGRIPHRLDAAPSRRSELETIGPRAASSGPFWYLELQQRELLGERLVTAEGELVGYEHRDAAYGAVVGYRFGGAWTAALRLGGLEAKLNGLTRATDERTLAALPSLGTRLRYLRLSSELAFDTRDRPGDPREGSFLSVSLSRYDDRSHGAYGFDRMEFDARRYQTLGSTRHVLALRALGSLDRPAEGDRVPLPLQPTLGGGYTLRGYESFRFRGQRVLSFSAEYRFQALRSVELTPFYDAGWVAGGLADVTRSGFVSSVGLGIRLKTGGSVAVRLDVARGDEGTRVHLRLGRSF